MPIVNVKGVANQMQFPDDMDINDIRAFLQKKFTQRAVGGQSDALSPQDNIAAPYKPSLMERAGQGVADVLSDTGIISNRYGAQQIGKNVAAIGEMLPGIGDVAAVDDFSRAAASGDNLGMGLAALGVIPVAGDIAGKAGKKATKWFHGTGADFTDFDNKFLGTANPATDSSFGFYFGKSSDTADAYRPSTTSLNPDKYESTYGRTIEEGRARVIKGKASFEKMFGMSHEDYTNLSEVERLKLDRSVDNIEAGGKQISNAESQLSPLHYEGHPYSLDEWVDEEKTGRIIEAELPTENMKEVDFGGKAWDEVKQSREARLAVDEGYDGVIFKDMQDSGWFGGSGTDDVALVFDANKIKQTSQAPVDVASNIKPAGGKAKDVLKSKYPDLKIGVSETADNIILDKVVVPDKLKGTGTKFMNDLIADADSKGKAIGLTPSSDFGGNKKRLTEFYKRFGFVENKGKNKDFTISESMIRPIKP